MVQYAEVGALMPSSRADTQDNVEPVRFELAPGTLIDRWVVESRVGGGGFGTVYKCTPTGSGPTVAIKVLRGELSADDRVLTRFDREVEALKRLRHENVVSVLDAGELSDGRPYLVMEWLDGRDLASELDSRGPLTPTEALAVLEDVGAALIAAHEQGIVHRDVKPSNLMALPNNQWFRVKLLDFGVAKLLEPIDGALTCTVTGQRLGTPVSMAPEQILGGELDGRADIYGLGVLLFRLLTGRQPFAADSPSELERMHLSSPRPRASKHAPVKPTIDDVIARAMAVDAADRFDSVQDFLAAVRHGSSSAKADAPPLLELRVEVKSYGALDDAMIDAMDDSLDRSRELCEQHQLRCVLDTGQILVAVSASADAIAAAREAIEASEPDELGFDIEITTGPHGR